MDPIVKKYLDDIESDFSIFSLSYKEASIYKKVLDIFEELGLISKKENASWQKKMMDKAGDTYLEDFHLSTRSYLALSRSGVKTSFQLREIIMNRRLLNIRNIGAIASKEILTAAIKNNIIKQDELPPIYRHFFE